MEELKLSSRVLFISATVLLAFTVVCSTAWAERIDIDPDDYGILSGLVYSDDNNTAIHESNEVGIPDVLVLLDGLIEPIEMDDPVAQMWGLGIRPLDPGEKETFQMFTWTDEYGRYTFENIPAGIYSVIEITPYEFMEGKANAPGSLGGTVVTSNQFADVAISAGSAGIGYNFGEWGLKLGYFSKRDFIVDPVPEPSLGVMIIGLGFLGICLRRRR